MASDDTLASHNGRRWRVGVLGNTNNYPFMVCRALRQMGHEAVQFIDRPEALHRPEGRYPEFASGYPSWIVDLSARPLLGSMRARRHRLALTRQLNGFDFLLINGNGPVFAAHSGLPSFALLTGTDLEHDADWQTATRIFKGLRGQAGLMRASVAWAYGLRAIRQQRAVIARSFGVNYFLRGLAPAGDRILDSLGVGDGQRSAFMISDVDAERVCRIQPRARPADAPLRIFNVARLNWREPRPSHLSSLDMKGTDILLRGFAAFIHRHGGRGELVLVRKGNDIAATAALVADLGLSDYVSWKDEMSQAQVFDEYEQAHVVSEQMSTSVIGMGGLDAMACGRALLANARPDVFEPMIGEPSPVLHATDADAVCQHLLALHKQPSLCASVGERSRDYVRRNFSAHAAARQILLRWEARQPSALGRPA